MGPLLTKRNTTSNMAKATSSTSTALLSLSITQYLKNQGQTYYVIKLSYFPRFRTNNVPCTVAIFLSFVQLSCPSNGLQLFFLTFKTETTSQQNFRWNFAHLFQIPSVSKGNCLKIGSQGRHIPSIYCVDKYPKIKMNLSNGVVMVSAGLEQVLFSIVRCGTALAILGSSQREQYFKPCAIP